MSDRRSHVKQLWEILNKGNEKGDDETTYLTVDGLQRLLADGQVRAQFASLGIEYYEAQGIFGLLDRTGAGRMKTSDFVYGCVRMKGGAKAIDLATLLNENKRLFDMLRHLKEDMSCLLQTSEVISEQLGSTVEV